MSKGLAFYKQQSLTFCLNYLTPFIHYCTNTYLILLIFKNKYNNLCIIRGRRSGEGTIRSCRGWEVKIETTEQLFRKFYIQKLILIFIANNAPTPEGSNKTTVGLQCWSCDHSDFLNHTILHDKLEVVVQDMRISLSYL